MRFGITAVAVVALSFGAAAHAGGSGSALFGAPAYLSTSVKKNGEPHELIDGTTVRVKFSHDLGDVVRWRSGCNHFGATVEITPKRLEVGRIDGTDIGCSKPLHRQDEWGERLRIGSEVGSPRSQAVAQGGR